LPPLRGQPFLFTLVEIPLGLPRSGILLAVLAPRWILLQFVILQQRVDFLGGHAFEIGHEHRVRCWLEAIVDQQRVDREIAGAVPQALYAVAATIKMQ
jgi:hypothetical protein